MSKRATEEALDDLHGEVAWHLTELIRSGGAKAADYTAAIKFLQLNGISAPADSKRLQGLKNAVEDDLPFGEDDDDTEKVVYPAFK